MSYRIHICRIFFGRCARLVKKYVNRVDGIRHASTIIEELSGQVNMLALNASIEAARAGEYGRGFAVVADNIRRLADESKMSTATIDQSINDLQEDLSTRINRITKAIQDVSVVSEETAAGAEEASAATEEQAATMEEMSASSQELTQLAIRLEMIVKQFKLPQSH